MGNTIDAPPVARVPRFRFAWVLPFATLAAAACSGRVEPREGPLASPTPSPDAGATGCSGAPVVLYTRTQSAAVPTGVVDRVFAEEDSVLFILDAPPPQTPQGGGPSTTELVRVAKGGGAPAVLAEGIQGLSFVDPAGPARSPSAAACNGADVYISEAAGIVRYSARDGQRSVFLPDEQAAWMVADAQDLIFSDSVGHIIRAPLDGSSLAVTLVSNVHASALALDAESVYFADASAGTVGKVTRVDSRVAVLAYTQGRPVRLALAGGVVAFAECVGPPPPAGQFPETICDPNAFDLAVRVVGKFGGAIGTLSERNGNYFGMDLAADDQAAYFTTNGNVWRAPLDGTGAPAALLPDTNPWSVPDSRSDLWYGTRLAVDAAHVFFASENQDARPNGGVASFVLEAAKCGG